MRITRKWIPPALALALLSGAGGCSSDDAAKPPVCDSFTAAQTTVDHIRDINISENGLTQLKPYLTQLRDQLTQLYNDAKAQFAPQADQLKASVTQLGTAARTAQADPSTPNLKGVRTALASVGDSWDNLRSMMAQTC